jgi:hypothetical protein
MDMGWTLAGRHSESSEQQDIEVCLYLLETDAEIVLMEADVEMERI